MPKITNKDLRNIFKSIRNKVEPEELYLFHTKNAWLRIRDLKMYYFTDEQLEAAPNNKGFICISNGVRLYLAQLLK